MFLNIIILEWFRGSISILEETAWYWSLLFIQNTRNGRRHISGSPLPANKHRPHRKVDRHIVTDRRTNRKQYPYWPCAPAEIFPEGQNQQHLKTLTRFRCSVQKIDHFSARRRRKRKFLRFLRRFRLKYIYIYIIGDNSFYNLLPYIAYRFWWPPIGLCETKLLESLRTKFISSHSTSWPSLDPRMLMHKLLVHVHRTQIVA